MDSKKRITVSWSGGKDCALALHKLLQSQMYEVVSLHTVFDRESKRVGMHGVQEHLIEAQAQRIGIPLVKLYLDHSEDHALYKQLISDFYKDCIRQDIHQVMFGDIFLEDLKSFRDAMLLEAGLKGIYPLWKSRSDLLIRDFFDVGFKCMLCAADSAYFGKSSLKNAFTKEQVSQLPTNVDLCGENGEYHTFVFDGPIFKTSVPFVTGEVLEKHYTYKVRTDANEEKTERKCFYFLELS